MDGIRVSPPYSGSGFTVKQRGRFLKVTADFGVILEFDGNQLKLSVPDDYQANVDGLCQNYNGNATDDYTTKEGLDVASDQNKYSLIGNSYQVEDPTDPTLVLLGANDNCYMF